MLEFRFIVYLNFMFNISMCIKDYCESVCLTPMISQAFEVYFWILRFGWNCHGQGMQDMDKNLNLDQTLRPQNLKYPKLRPIWPILGLQWHIKYKKHILKQTKDSNQFKTKPMNHKNPKTLKIKPIWSIFGLQR